MHYINSEGNFNYDGSSHVLSICKRKLKVIELQTRRLRKSRNYIIDTLASGVHFSPLLSLTCGVVDAEERCEWIILGHQSVSNLSWHSLVPVLGLHLQDLRKKR